MNSECEGCIAHDIAAGECTGLRVDNCPCLNCLVKVMCIKVCDELSIHMEKARIVYYSRWMSLY